MDAKIYLKSLQKDAKPRAPAPVEQILERRSRQFGIDKKELREIIGNYDGSSFDGLEKLLADQLIEPFLSLLPAQVGLELRGVPVGVLPTFDPNAFAVQVPGNGPLILLHSELLAAVSFYNELQFLVMRLVEKGKVDQGLELLHSGHRFVVGCFRADRSLNYPILPTSLGEKDLGMVQMKTFANELFIIAHEFAHVHLGHLQELDVMPLITRHGGVAVNAYNKNQQMELEADVQAIEWLAELHNRGIQKNALALPSASVATAAEVLMLVHVVEVNTHKDTLRSLHPPAIQRLQHILNTYSNILNTDDKELIADMIENALDEGSFKTES